MANVLGLNGKRYSKKYFVDYEYRVKIKINLIDGSYSNIDIYTTDNNKDSIHNVLINRATEKVKSIEILSFHTREEDDLISEMLNELIF